jgi:hypothetical protein
MKKDQRRNENVVAPEQKVKTITEIIGDYLIGLGFKAYGLAGEHQLFTRDFSDAGSHLLCFLVKDAAIRIYKGFRHFRCNETGIMKRTIGGHLLHECNAPELEETLGLLAERNYI